MRKKYDQDVTPQNTPYFKQRRMLFQSAMGFFVLNLILTGILAKASTLLLIGMALVFAAFTVVQSFDKRSEMWTWGYILSWIAFSFISSAVIFLTCKTYWLFIAYAIEIALFVLLYKKIFKRVRRRPPEAVEK